jgi:hypothetical protein
MGVPRNQEVTMGVTTMMTAETDPALNKLVRDEYRRFLKVPEVRVVLEKMSMKKGISIEAAFRLLLDEMAREAIEIKIKSPHLFL